MDDWRIYNGWGPGADGLMRAQRIGPAAGGGIQASEPGADIAGTREDLELAAQAPVMRGMIERVAMILDAHPAGGCDAKAALGAIADVITGKST